MERAFRIRHWAGVVVVLGCTALMGCGGDDGTSSTGAGGAASTGGGSATGGTTGTGGGEATTSAGGGTGTGGGGMGGDGSGGMGSGGRGMSMGDMQQDDFEAQMLSGNWQVIFPPPPNTQVQILDGSDLGMGPGPQGFFLVNWVGTSFAADQFCEATIPLDVNPDWLHQVYVRWRAADGARYGFHYNGDPGQPGFGNWAFKYDGVPSAQTRVIAEVPAVAVPPPGPGDTLRIEVQGYELRGYKNGVLVLTETDTDPSKIADGQVGLAARWATGNQGTSAPAKVWESWAGGSL